MNAAIPIAMPNGVVIAKSIESVAFSQSIFHDSLEEDSESVCVGGSEAILTPRESPSNSWWNTIALTSDAARGR